VAAGLNWRAKGWRALGRPREFSVLHLQRAVETGLLGLVAAGAAGLFWAVFVPVNRVDDGVTAPVKFDASPAAFAAFDPFFHLARSNGQPGVITSLNLTLHGVRADRASGRGSAIIGLPDGTQNSYAVGDEIVPGARLYAVGFDSVTIRRNGSDETLVLDQSTALPAAPTVAVGGQADPFAAIRAGGAVASSSLIADIDAEPRLSAGRIDGFVLKPGSSGRAFADAGLQPGDVLLSVEGRKVGSGAGIEQLATGGKPIAVEVERAGKRLTLTVGRGQ